MSSLAEINKRLIENYEEQERTSKAIEDVRTAIQDQLKIARRSRLDEAEDKKEQKAKATRTQPQGFRQGLAEGAGLAGLGRFGQSLLGALFGGLSGAGLATMAGTVAGKILKGGVLSGLVLAFGEDAIKSLFEKLREKGLDISDEQINDYSARTTDGLLAYILSGIVLKNPIARLGLGIAAAFKDKILTAIPDFLGIKVTKSGEDYIVDIPNLGVEDLNLSDDWMNGIIAIAGGFVLYAGNLIRKAFKNIISTGETKLDKRVSKIIAEQQARIAALETKLAADQAQAEKLSKIASTAPKAPTFDVGDRVGYTRTDGTKVDATVTQRLPSGLTQLQFEQGGKIAVDTSKITAPTDVTKITGAIDKGFNKVLRTTNVLSVEGIAEEASRYGASRTAGITSRLLGGTARVLGSMPALAASFVMGGLFENEAGDQTLSGVVDAQGYALLEAMANGASEQEIKEKRQNLFDIVTDPLYSSLATPTHKALSMLSDKELMNLSSMVYAQSTGQIRGAVGKISPRQLGSGRIGMGRAKYGEELSALDTIAAERKAMNISPVIIQDSSIKTSGGNTQITNQMNIPVSSVDVSTVQRNQGLGPR